MLCPFAASYRRSAISDTIWRTADIQRVNENRRV